MTDPFGAFCLAAAAFLLVVVLVGLVRVVRGPASTDRMLGVQLLGTAGVGVLLLLARGLAQPGFRDVALVLALLAVLAVVALVRRVAPSRDRGGTR